ncbi:unnamed protein product [Dovyalis caffra]|uniref:Wall-associated receptor kinase galacturonan-binding domain-containing protein n=1 Tax=Dovyalis caffra TaxID=77055 RepID=A0AAV1RHT7_9ROSI|nr:unnamed protein product [Dovyalis caffra]
MVWVWGTLMGRTNTASPTEHKSEAKAFPGFAVGPLSRPEEKFARKLYICVPSKLAILVTSLALCAPSSCGNIQNISYPFRLDTDPKSCGDNNYTLICEKNTSTGLYLYSSKYYVRAIDYVNFTIRVVDAGVQGNCSSLPRYSLDPHKFRYGDPYAWYSYKWTVPPRVIQRFFYNNIESKWSPPTLLRPMIFMSRENPDEFLSLCRHDSVQP